MPGKKRHGGPRLKRRASDARGGARPGAGRKQTRIVTDARDGRLVRERLLQRHGLTAEEAFDKIVGGELVTVLMDDDERREVVRCLHAAALHNVAFQIDA